MCGRFNITSNPKALLEVFEILAENDRLPKFEPRYNVAPSEPPVPADSKRKSEGLLTSVPIIRLEDDALIAEEVTWPMIPIWAKGEVPKYSTANARADTMQEKNSYRHAWGYGQRCLLIATGFYEWQDAGEKTKQPWCVQPANDEFFTFGGLWERSYDADDNEVRSCTIVTMPANPLMREIHNAGRNKHRMPLILDGDARSTWLNGGEDDALSLIEQYPADEMHAFKIGRMVNNPHADDPKIVEPLMP